MSNHNAEALICRLASRIADDPHGFFAVGFRARRRIAARLPRDRLDHFGAGFTDAAAFMAKIVFGESTPAPRPRAGMNRCQ